MKRKGFTLIELLAVIVILSVITLITVPMITSVIEESKKKALVSSVQGLIESANLYSIENEGVHEFLFDREHQGSTQSGESLDYKGKIEGAGKLYIDKEGNTSICISNDTYYVYKNYNSDIIIGERSKDNCNIEYDALTNKYVAFLESTGSGSNVYSKDEVNNLVDSLDTKITNNTNEISNINDNLNNLSSFVSNNSENINRLNSKLNIEVESEQLADNLVIYRYGKLRTLCFNSYLSTVNVGSFQSLNGLLKDIDKPIYNGTFFINSSLNNKYYVTLLNISTDGLFSGFGIDDTQTSGYKYLTGNPSLHGTINYLVS